MTIAKHLNFNTIVLLFVKDSVYVKWNEVCDIYASLRKEGHIALHKSVDRSQFLQWKIFKNLSTPPPPGAVNLVGR